MLSTTRLNHPAFTWLMALIWSVLIIIILLKPGSGVTTHELTLSAFFTSFFSLSITRKDLSEAIAHVFLFVVLTALWQRVLTMYLSRPGVILSSIGIAFILATVTEIGQYFVNRGSLFFDLIANLLGIAIAIYGFDYVKKLKIK